MKTWLWVLLFTFLGYSFSFSQAQKGWTLIQQKCTPCHKNSSFAPFDFSSIEEVNNYSKTIVFCLNENIMPLWFATSKNRHYFNERVLSYADKREILQWFDQLEQKGVAAIKADLLPISAAVNNFPPPNHTISTTNWYKFQEQSDQVFLNFKKNEVPIKGFIKGATIRYSEEKIVHHGVVYGIDSTNKQVNLLESTSGDFKGNTVGDVTLGVYAPGVNYALLPDGFAYEIGNIKGLLFETHLLGTQEEIKVEAHADLYYCKEEQPRLVQTINLANLEDKGPILPNTVKTYHGKHLLKDSTSLLALMPHMHKIAVAFNSYAVTPTNDTLELLNLAKWSFEWQTIYRLNSMLVLPPNTVVHFQATFDNTETNLQNPSNPPQIVWVNQGWSIKNEMLIFGLQYVSYQKGDENHPLHWVSLEPF